MKYLVILLFAGLVSAGEPPVDDSYKLYWTNIMRGQGVSKDTIAMFLDAPDCPPINDSLMTLRANGVWRIVSSDGKKGSLLVVKSKKKVETVTNGHTPIQYFFEIETIPIFDIGNSKK